MNDAHYAVDAAIAEAERLHRLLQKNRSRQIRANEEQLIMKSTALAWFNNHRVAMATVLDEHELSDVDQLYQQVLSSSQRQSLRSSCVSKLERIKDCLVSLRSQNVIKLTATGGSQQTSDQPPQFSPLIPDPQMQAILVNRWKECTRCIAADAPFAATVMMGGLLEALLLARINHETNKAPILKAAGAPKDKKTGQTLQLKDWVLRNYLDVAHELGWISQSVKDISEVLRDYRNYIHPYKEFSDGVTLVKNDAAILWEISKSISRQIIDSV